MTKKWHFELCRGGRSEIALNFDTAKWQSDIHLPSDLPAQEMLAEIEASMPAYLRWCQRVMQDVSNFTGQSFNFEVSIFEHRKRIVASPRFSLLAWWWRFKHGL